MGRVVHDYSSHGNAVVVVGG